MTKINSWRSTIYLSQSRSLTSIVRPGGPAPGFTDLQADFVRRPEAFFTLAKELYPGNFKPTLAHYFFVLLHQKEILLR